MSFPQIIQKYIDGLQKIRDDRGHNITLTTEGMYGGTTLDCEILLARERLERAKANVKLMGNVYGDTYVFVSFGSLHTGENLGCCIVKVDDPEQANEECRRLGLMPAECNQARAYVLDEAAFLEQGLELNHFYSAAEMSALGFEMETTRIE